MNLLLRTGILLSLLAPLSACGPKLELASELEPYVQRFESESAKYGRPILVSNLSMHFGDHAEFVAMKLSGYCKGEDTIRIDPVFWENASEAQREKLAFHELGHCVLKRKQHSYDPVSIMRSGTVSTEFYNANREALLQELFTNAS